MPDGVRLRLRRAAIALVFVVGVVATAATSPAMTFIDIAPAGATFHLDPGHPAALSRFVVRLNPEATSSYSYLSVYLLVDAVRAAGGSVAASGAVGAARFIVASAAPGALPSPIASPLPGVEPVPTRWQAEVSPPAQVSLPIDCGGAVGPCERGFWLIAELADPAAGAIDAHWSVGGSLSYTGNAWPSGARASVEIGAPTLLASPVPQLAASTETETVAFGPDRPAAAREVEVTCRGRRDPAGWESGRSPLGRPRPSSGQRWEPRQASRGPDLPDRRTGRGEPVSRRAAAVAGAAQPGSLRRLPTRRDLHSPVPRDDRVDRRLRGRGSIRLEAERPSRRPRSRVVDAR